MQFYIILFLSLILYIIRCPITTGDYLFTCSFRILKTDISNPGRIFMFLEVFFSPVAHGNRTRSEVCNYLYVILLRIYNERLVFMIWSEYGHYLYLLFICSNIFLIFSVKYLAHFDLSSFDILLPSSPSSCSYIINIKISVLVCFQLDLSQSTALVIISFADAFSEKFYGLLFLKPCYQACIFKMNLFDVCLYFFICYFLIIIG